MTGDDEKEEKERVSKQLSDVNKEGEERGKRGKSCFNIKEIYTKTTSQREKPETKVLIIEVRKRALLSTVLFLDDLYSNNDSDHDQDGEDDEEANPSETDSTVV